MKWGEETFCVVGAQECWLHHLADDTLTHDSELVLLEAGCELRGYASDVTPSFPANGPFGDAQCAVCDVVLF
jgi:Xaa-Pro aminopeptidase